MKTKTTVYDPLASFPPAARQHLRECAEEMGIDPLEYRSHEEIVILPDGIRKCEVWYDEDSSSPWAWKAFVLGVGTRSGTSREDALAQFTNRP